MRLLLAALAVRCLLPTPDVNVTGTLFYKIKEKKIPVNRKGLILKSTDFSETAITNGQSNPREGTFKLIDESTDGPALGTVYVSLAQPTKQYTGGPWPAQLDKNGAATVEAELTKVYGKQTSNNATTAAVLASMAANCSIWYSSSNADISADVVMATAIALDRIDVWEDANKIVAVKAAANESISKMGLGASKEWVDKLVAAAANLPRPLPEYKTKKLGESWEKLSSLKSEEALAEIDLVMSFSADDISDTWVAERSVVEKFVTSFLQGTGASGLFVIDMTTPNGPSQFPVPLQPDTVGKLSDADFKLWSQWPEARRFSLLLQVAEKSSDPVVKSRALDYLSERYGLGSI